MKKKVVSLVTTAFLMLSSATVFASQSEVPAAPNGEYPESFEMKIPNENTTKAKGEASITSKELGITPAASSDVTFNGKTDMWLDKNTNTVYCYGLTYTDKTVDSIAATAYLYKDGNLYDYATTSSPNTYIAKAETKSFSRILDLLATFSAKTYHTAKYNGKSYSSWSEDKTL